MKSRALAVLCFASILGSASAQAQVIDQQDNGAGTPLAYAQFWQGQTFTPSQNTVAGAGVWLNSYNGGTTTANLTMQLWTARPDLGGTLLAGGSTAFSVAPGDGGTWADVFWAAVSVTPSTQYALVFSTDNADYTVATSYDSAGPAAYPTGAYFYGAGNGVGGPYYHYTPYYDTNFREYSVGTTATPEPASLTLLATGLLGLGAVARKRRARAT